MLFALVLVATALRPQLVGIGPLLPRISDDLGMPHWQAGLLGTIPVLCMGLFALPAGKVASWIGTKRAVGASVLAIGVFGLARAASDSAAALAARRGEVWDIVAMFALMSLIYYGFVAWLPDAYVEHGWSEASAAGVMAVLTAAQIPGGMIVASLADRHRRAFVLGFAMLGLLGSAGLAAAPPAAWVWSALVGLSIGALFPLVLTLPLDLEDHPAGVAAVIGVVLGAGYSVAALAPTLLGALRDLSGTFAGALWSLVAVAVLLLAFSHRVLSRTPARAAPARI